MKTEEFFRNLTNSNFKEFVKGGDYEKFREFLENLVINGGEKLVLRCLCVQRSVDEIGIPYYLWIAYNLNDDVDTVEIYPPDFDNPDSLLSQPEELEGQPYFEFAVED